MAGKKIKKDFDKEMMYQKIMPSISSNLAMESDEQEETPELPKVAKESGQSKAASQPETAQKPAKPQGAPQYVLRNFVEDMALERLGRTIEMLKACGCEKCKKDAMALALNEVPPHYAAVSAEDVEAEVDKLRSQFEIKIASALIKAIQTVKASPRHDEL